MPAQQLRQQKALRKLSKEVSRVERLYATYTFRGKDPIISKLRHALRPMKLADVAETSGVSIACLRGWFTGRTRRPQFATVKAVANAIGMTL